MEHWFEMSNDLLCKASFDGHFTLLNSEWERCLGYTLEELLAIPYLELLHPEDVQPTIAVAGGLADAPSEIVNFENRYRAKDGTYRWLLWSSRSDGEQIYGVAKDISARKAAEAEVHAAREEAERANRAKSEFLSRMSHELRTPLNAILGFAQVLDLAALDPPHDEQVRHILKGGRHLLDLINEVLDISRIEAGTLALSMEAVMLGDAVADAMSLVRPLADERGIALRTDLRGLGSRYVSADRQRLKQVLLNLLANAIKYNRRDGTAGIALEDAGNGRLRLLVTDEGPGIPWNRLAELFVPFERLGAEGSEEEGTGLGLTLSLQLVDLMGGRLNVDSTPGKGATFAVDLAEADAPEQRASPDVAEVATHAEALSGTLLVIEDNVSNVTLVETLVRGRDVKVIPAMKGELGFELAVLHEPNLILLDLHLPDTPGGEILRRLRAEPATRSIPVVVISADATDGQVKRLLEDGAQGYLTKPLDVGRFMTMVSEHLGTVS